MKSFQTHPVLRRATRGAMAYPIEQRTYKRVCKYLSESKMGSQRGEGKSIAPLKPIGKSYATQPFLQADILANKAKIDQIVMLARYITSREFMQVIFNLI